MKLFLSTVRKYKNKNHLLHLRTVKYGRRTPKSIFIIRLYYVKIVSLVKAFLYVLFNYKKAVASAAEHEGEMRKIIPLLEWEKRWIYNKIKGTKISSLIRKGLIQYPCRNSSNQYQQLPFQVLK